MTSLYAAVDMNQFRSDIGRPSRPSEDKLTALDVVKLALAHKADPNATLKKTILGRHHNFGDGSLGDGATALMRAAKGPDLEAMEALLDAGANPSLGMTKGSNAAMILAGTRGGPGAAKAATALRLLTKHGADVNSARQRAATDLVRSRQSCGSNAISRCGTAWSNWELTPPLRMERARPLWIWVASARPEKPSRRHRGGDSTES